MSALIATRAVIKRCGCGRDFTQDEWSGLPHVGNIHTPADQFGPAETIELRNCPCGSSIAIDVPEEKKP